MSKEPLNLASLTRPELIFPGLACADRASLLRTLSERITEQGEAGDAETLYAKLVEREELGSTGIGSGVAIPHCKMKRLDEVVLAVATLRKGVDYGAVDKELVRLVFVVVSPTSAPAVHLRCLAAISKWIKIEHQVGQILGLEEPAAIYELLEASGVG